MHLEIFAPAKKYADSSLCYQKLVWEVFCVAKNGAENCFYLSFLSRLKPGLLLAIIMLVLLTACSNSINTPIKAPYYRDLSHGVKSYTVRRGDTLYSIGYRSGFGYKRLAQWNKIRPPYNLSVGQRIKLYKPYRPGKVSKKRKRKRSKKRNKSQKKPIISTNNKNMLKLSWHWPMKGKILKSFSRTGNKGIDIGGKYGQSVRAAERGKVVYSGQGLIGYGNLLIIKHNYLYLTAYANNSRLLVKEGQTVKRGQVIAKVGKLGSKRAALHFEIRKKGEPVNPIKYLPHK